MKTFALIRNADNVLVRLQQHDDDFDPRTVAKFGATKEHRLEPVEGDQRAPTAEIDQTVETRVEVVDGRPRWVHETRPAPPAEVNARARELLETALADAGGPAALIAQLAEAALPPADREREPWAGLIAAANAHADRLRPGGNLNPGGRN